MYFLGAHSSEGSSAIDVLYAIICVVCFLSFVIPKAFSSSRKKRPQAQRPAPRQDFRQVVFDEPRDFEDDASTERPRHPAIRTEDFWRDNEPEAPQPAKKPAPATNSTASDEDAGRFSLPHSAGRGPLAVSREAHAVGYHAIFATRKELRDAVLASEILGKPKALRDTHEPWEMF